MSSYFCVSISLYIYILQSWACCFWLLGFPGSADLPASGSVVPVSKPRIAIGPQQLPTLWSHIPNIATVSFSSENIPRDGIGSHLGLHIKPKKGSAPVCKRRRGARKSGTPPAMPRGPASAARFWAFQPPPSWESQGCFIGCPFCGCPYSNNATIWGL